jgi:hypothetical protein
MMVADTCRVVAIEIIEAAIKAVVIKIAIKAIGIIMEIKGVMGAISLGTMEVIMDTVPSRGNGSGFQGHDGELDLEVSYGPSFEEASGYVTQCFIDTGNINLNFNASRGERFALSDTVLARSSEVKGGMVVMVSQFTWERNDRMDVDTAASSGANILFVEVVGDPRMTTRCKVIGLLKPNIGNDRFAVSERFLISTPNRFLIPRGSYAVAVEEIKSQEKASALQIKKPVSDIQEGKAVIDNLKGICFGKPRR